MYAWDEILTKKITHFQILYPFLSIYQFWYLIVLSSKIYICLYVWSGCDSLLIISLAISFFGYSPFHDNAS